MINLDAKLYGLYADLLDIQRELELGIEEPDSNKIALYGSLRNIDEAVTILKRILIEGDQNVKRD